jgi:hypothetical protein
MSRHSWILVLAGALLGSSVLMAQDFDVMLTPAQHRELSGEALARYNAALDKIDRVDHATALDELAQAAALAADHIELQFLVAKYARHRAEVSYGEESLRCYDMAEMALRRLLGNPRLGPEERTRVRRESERVREGKENLRARDDARLRDGFRLVTQIREERRDRMGITKREAELHGIEQVLRKQEKEEEAKLTKADIWTAFGAPGLAIVDPVAQAGPFGAYGQAAAGFDPFLGGGFDPSIPGMGNPFAGGGTSPSYVPPAGGAGFADPFAGPPGGQQPSSYFGGGGGDARFFQDGGK